MNSTSIPHGAETEQESYENDGCVANTTTEDAQRLWDEAKPITETSPVGVYLQRRKLWPLPLRVRLRQGGYPVDKHKHAWTLVASLTDFEGNLRAVQILLLDQDGWPLEKHRQDGSPTKDRRTIGPADGTCCRLMHIPPPPAPNMDRPLGLTEGVEDALAVWHMHKQKFAVWAACGAGRMAAFRPPVGVTDLAICADHDRPGSWAALACARAVRALPLPRALVSILWSPNRGWDPWQIYSEGGEFVPMWQDRAPRNPLMSLGQANNVRMVEIARMAGWEQDQAAGKLAEATKVPKRTILRLVRAHRAENRFSDEATGPLLELAPLRQEMFTRMEDLLSESETAFTQGEGSGRRVVAVEVVTEERRRELEKQEIYVVTGQPMIVPVNQHMLADRIEIAYYVYEETEEGPQRADFPLPIAAGWLQSGRAACLPTLRGIAPYPVIRRDGEVVDRLGYDRRSAFWLTWAGGALAVPETPTTEEAKAAVAEFLGAEGEKGKWDGGLFRTYPFEKGRHRLGALAFVFQLLDRHNHRLSPAWVFDAPTPRTGKMHLQRTCALLALGAPPVIYAMSDNREERHKRVTHALIDGSPLVCLDNINGAFDSSDVATYLGEGRCLLRSYGMTGLSPLAVNSNTLSFTGNNITMTKDMQTRCGKIRLDSGEADPAKRKFAFDPWKAAQEDRARWLTAALTILRWGSQTDLSELDLPGLGIFTEWDARIRRPLFALTGHDVALCFEDMLGDDPEAEQMGLWFVALKALMGERRFTAADLGRQMSDWWGGGSEEDRAVVASLPFRFTDEPKSIGTRLASWQGKHGGGLRLVRYASTGHRVTEYQVSEQAEPGDGGKRG